MSKIALTRPCFLSPVSHRIPNTKPAEQLRIILSLVFHPESSGNACAPFKVAAKSNPSYVTNWVLVQFKNSNAEKISCRNALVFRGGPCGRRSGGERRRRLLVNVCCTGRSLTLTLCVHAVVIQNQLNARLYAPSQ